MVITITKVLLKEEAITEVVEVTKVAEAAEAVEVVTKAGLTMTSELKKHGND